MSLYRSCICTPLPRRKRSAVRRRPRCANQTNQRRGHPPNTAMSTATLAQWTTATHICGPPQRQPRPARRPAQPPPPRTRPPHCQLRAAVGDSVGERLEHQLHLLNLNDRYQREINTYLATQATGLKLAFDVDGSAQANPIWNDLESQADVYATRFHANYWIAILMLALSLDAPFCSGAFSRPLRPA